MRGKIGLALLFLFVSTSVNADVNVVRSVRAKYPNLPGNPEVTVTALKEIAVKVKGGIYVKTSGNNCLGYSCDIICFADGRGYDVFVGWENNADAGWQPVGTLDTSRCRLQTSIPEPTPEPPSLDEDIKQIRRIVEEIGRRFGIQ